MTPKITTYNSEGFRREYFNSKSELDRLFEKSITDFFCLRIEDLMSGVLKPILPSREESHTVIVVTEGAYRTKIDFREYAIQADRIVIIPAGAVFSVDEIVWDVKGYVVHFHLNVLIGLFGNRLLISEFEFLNPGTYPVIHLGGSSKSAILNLLERLVSEFKGMHKPNSNIIHSYLYALLTELKLLLGQGRSESPSASHRTTSQFRALAHQRVKDNLKVADFAKLLHISPNHLNKSVKSITSKSATALLEEIKLIEIKYLLYQSHLTISEISYAMGYSD